MKKKLLSVLMILSLGITLFGCKVLRSNDHDYLLVGNSSDTLNVELEAISRSDKRIKPFKDSLKNAVYLYFAQVELNANQEIAIVKKDKDGNTVWSAQSLQSGQVENLSSDLLMVPQFVAGTWNDFAKVKESGTYYLVFAEIFDGIKSLGLIRV